MQKSPHTRKHLQLDFSVVGLLKRIREGERREGERRERGGGERERERERGGGGREERTEKSSYRSYSNYLL
jgi:hypothetical protein